MLYSQATCQGRRRRGGRIGETAGRNGHVTAFPATRSMQYFFKLLFLSPNLRMHDPAVLQAFFAFTSCCLFPVLTPGLLMFSFFLFLRPSIQPAGIHESQLSCPVLSHFTASIWLFLLTPFFRPVNFSATVFVLI